jgi:Flp pilus assembly protein CpaB
MLCRSPRAALLGVAAVVVAVATAAYVADVLASLRHQDAEFGRVGTVVVAARDLALGHRVRPADLATRRVRGRPGEPHALTRVPTGLGRVVAVPVLRGAVVTTRHLAPARRDGRRGGRRGVVPAGRRAMRVAIDGGVRPQPGDPVDLYATFDPQAIGAAVEPTLTVARGVPVVAVDRAGTTTGGGEATVGVTVLVTPEEARRLAFATAAGTLALAIAPPEDAARS